MSRLETPTVTVAFPEAGISPESASENSNRMPYVPHNGFQTDTEHLKMCRKSLKNHCESLRVPLTKLKGGLNARHKREFFSESV